MSSRFVSGGTISSSGEVSKDAPAVSSSTADAKPLHAGAKIKEWEIVQQELEAERKRREEQRVKAASGEGERSLFEILEANKAAKQAAFEEQSKLRNQFRALDDDEIEFLDDVRAAKRAEEDRVRRETEDGLRAFRERQKGGGGGGTLVVGGDRDAGVDDEGESWGVGKKRKRVKDRDVKGVRRRVSSGEADAEKKAVEPQTVKAVEVETNKKSQEAAKLPEKKSLGLVGYGSDSDDD
ncbi:N-terminal domain of NEFA-interacting nuclear protein NIP30-domain-containing protein [Dactylonectria estremocensis]|uniref:N-terminal domain of NEFA-interacting nuclear protein NIP30-domain-containing protein n=1 Tax=Dactylonectria estremocensis TaxID=1079267 RepID=A0A9P9IYU7_9HYPO|nr:N-terminal domain of NEFA-interacting nuclear protein NIP30-domain-containing protein [Dactylonectria estremocensis]